MGGSGIDVATSCLVAASWNTVETTPGMTHQRSRPGRPLLASMDLAFRPCFWSGIREVLPETC